MTHPAADPYHSVRTPTAYVGRLAALERVGRSLNATLDMDQNLDQIVREAVANTSATQASVLVTTQPAGRLHLYACCGYTTEEQRALAARAQQGQSLADRVLATGQVQASGENQDLPSAPARLAVPIRYGEQIVGVLDLQDETEGVFDDGSRQFASVLAEQAAVAIGSSWRYTEQVRREAAARRRLAQLGDLIAISHVLHTGQELDELLDQVVQAIPDTGGFNVVLLSLVESGNGVLRRVAAAGIPLADFRALQEVKQPLSAFERLLQPQYRISASYLIPHQEAQAWEQVLDVYVSLSESLPPGPGQWHPRDMLLVPLHDSKGDPQDGRVPGRAEIEILELFAGQAALAIESARLYNELELRVQQRTEELATALRRQASEANKTRAILESISDAVIVCDVQGEVILANPATTRVLDLPVEVLLGRRLDACTSFAGLLPSQAAMAGAILEAARAARRSLERGQALVHTVFQAAGRSTPGFRSWNGRWGRLPRSPVCRLPGRWTPWWPCSATSPTRPSCRA
jgi:PAS domain-containing protein